MTQISIAAWQPYPNYSYSGTTATLRVYYSEGFIASDGRQVLEGNGITGFYLPVDCTVVSGLLHVPSFSLTSTDNALTETAATVSGTVYDQTDTPRENLFSQFQIPNRLAPSTTIGILTTYNQARALINPVLQFLDRDQTIALIEQIAGNANFASDVVAGKTYLDVAPDDATHPIAVGINSPLVNTTVGSNIPTDGTDAYAIFNAVVAEQVALPATEQREIRLPSGNILISRPLQIKGFCTVKPSPGGQSIIQGTFGAGPTIVTKQSTVNIDTGPSLVPGPGVSMRLRPGAFPWLSLEPEPNMDLASVLRPISALTIRFTIERLSQVANGVWFAYTNNIGQGPTNSIMIMEGASNDLVIYWNGVAHTSAPNVFATFVGINVALTYNGSVVKGYVNAVEVISFAYSGPIPGNLADCPAIGRQPIGLSGQIDAFGPPDGYIDNIEFANVVRTITNPFAKFTADAHTLLLLKFNHLIDCFVQGEVGNRAGNLATSWLNVEGTPELQFQSPTLNDFTIQGNGAYFGTSGLLAYDSIRPDHPRIRTLAGWMGNIYNGVTYSGNMSGQEIQANRFGFAQINQSEGTTAIGLNVLAGGHACYFTGSVGGFYSGIVTPGSTAFSSIYVNGTNEVNWYHVQIDDEGQAPQASACVIANNALIKFIGGLLAYNEANPIIVNNNGGSEVLLGVTLLGPTPGPAEFIIFNAAPNTPAFALGCIRAFDTSKPLTLTPQYLISDDQTTSVLSAPSLNVQTEYQFQGSSLLTSHPVNVQNPPPGATAAQLETTLIALLDSLRDTSFLDLQNLALASNGGVMSASSTLSLSYAASKANDGNITGATAPNVVDYWNSSVQGNYPEYLTCTLGANSRIYRVVVYSVQDNYLTPSQPTPTMISTRFGLKDLQIETWDGASWVLSDTVTGNDLIIKTVRLSAPVETTKIRIKINATIDPFDFCRCVEFQAFGELV